jgi:hypothetical protein
MSYFMPMGADYGLEHMNQGIPIRRRSRVGADSSRPSPIYRPLRDDQRILLIRIIALPILFDPLRGAAESCKVIMSYK